MPNWLKSVLVGGIVAVAGLLADNHVFNFSGEGLLHLFEIFIAGAAAAFLLLFEKGAPGSQPGPQPAK